MSLTCEAVLEAARNVVEQEGAHPFPTLLLQYPDHCDVVALDAPRGPWEALPRVLPRLVDLVVAAGLPLTAMAFAADTYIREFASAADVPESLGPAKDDPTARDALVAWCQTVGEAPRVLAQLYTAELQLDGTYAVAWDKATGPPEAISGRLMASLENVLTTLHAISVAPADEQQDMVGLVYLFAARAALSEMEDTDAAANNRN